MCLLRPHPLVALFVASAMCLSLKKKLAYIHTCKYGSWISFRNLTEQKKIWFARTAWEEMGVQKGLTVAEILSPPPSSSPISLSLPSSPLSFSPLYLLPPHFLPSLLSLFSRFSLFSLLSLSLPSSLSFSIISLPFSLFAGVFLQVFFASHWR